MFLKDNSGYAHIQIEFPKPQSKPKISWKKKIVGVINKLFKLKKAGD